MKQFLGKKAVLLGTLVIALGVAVYLNYYLAKDTTDLFPQGNIQTQQSGGDKTLGEAINVNGAVTEPTSEEYFAQARKSREESRGEAMLTVKEMLADVKATDAQKQAAAAEVLAITKAMERESNIEALIKAKGFADCVVYLADDSCSVVVKSEGLSVQDTVKISQVVTSQADIPSQKINIVSVK